MSRPAVHFKQLVFQVLMQVIESLLFPCPIESSVRGEFN